MKPLRIMSFNIHNSGSADEFTGRRNSIASLIRNESPDLIGMQELLDDMIPGLDFMTESYGFTGKARGSKRANERCCVVYRKDRFRLLRSKTLWLSDSPEIPGTKFYLSMFPRIVTIAVLEDMENNMVFTFANTHLDHVLPPARKKQIDVMKELLEEYREGEFLILTGDFNCTSDDSSVHSLLGDRELDLRNPAVSTPKDLMRDFMHMASSRYRPIDMILVSSALRVDSYASLHGLYEGKYPTDHTPILITAVPEREEIEPKPEELAEVSEIPLEQPASQPKTQ